MLEAGHDVFLCTSPLTGSRWCAPEKLAWVERHLGPAWVSRTIITSDKTLVGDRLQPCVLVDDQPTITGAASPPWTHVLFDAPYNQSRARTPVVLLDRVARRNRACPCRPGARDARASVKDRRCLRSGPSGLNRLVTWELSWFAGHHAAVADLHGRRGRTVRHSGRHSDTGTIPGGTSSRPVSTFFRSSDSRPYAGERASRLRRVLAHTGRQGDNDGMAGDQSKARPPLRWSLMLLLDGTRPSRTLGWVSLCRPRRYPGRRRGRALGRWTPAAGPGRVGGRCWPWAGGVGPWHGSADPGRGGREHPGPDAQAWHGGPGYRRDGDTCGPPAIAVLPAVRPCFPLSGDGHRRAVAPAPPAAADGARDRRGSPDRRIQCPPGGLGRAAAQAEDRRRLSPGRIRIGSPAAGSIG